jgi:hypothetical protein
MMERSQLEGLKLEALRTLALEKGLAGASQLGRAQLIAALATPEPAPETDGADGQADGGASASTTTPASASETVAASEPVQAQTAPEPEPELEPTPSPSASVSLEPTRMLDLEDPPETYSIDECEAMYKDPTHVFVWWEITEAGLASAHAQLGPSAASTRRVLRLFTTLSGPRGIERHVQDVDIDWNHGRRYLPVPKPGAHLRVAVGLISPEGYFASIAHSSLLRVPPTGPAEAIADDWMEVQPGQPGTLVRTAIAIGRRGSGFTERGQVQEVPSRKDGPAPGSPGYGSGSGGLS